MENLKSFHDHLGDSQSQARKLNETTLVLNGLFAEEETRLHREDEVSNLRVLHRAIVGQLQQLKCIEASAGCGHSQGNAILSLIGLTVTAIVSKDNWPSAIKDYLLREPTNRKQPFGLVMVRVGPGGLPDDVDVVSISQLARKSRREQTEVTNKLRHDGYLLFSEEVFSLLIDRSVDAIRGGKLHLPVSREKLAEIMGLGKLKPSIRFIEAK